MKKFSTVVSVILSAMILLTACNSGNTQKASSTAQPSSSAKPGAAADKKGGTVRYGIWSSPPGVFMPNLSTDGYDNIINQVVFEGLVDMNTKYEYEPGLAESWEISKDNLTFTFKLRKNVKWHDGKPFTADDVKYSFEYIANPGYTGSRGSTINAIKGYNEFKKGQTKDLEGLKIIDPYTVSITTSQIYGTALNSFGYTVKIMPKHIWEKVEVSKSKDATELLRNPIGTGPFKMSKFVPDQYTELVANEDYWGGRPNIDKLAILVTNQETVSAKILKGELDMVNMSDLVESQIQQYKSAGFSFQEVPFASAHCLVINNELPEFKDKRVRQAFAYAIDRESMVKNLIDGHGYVANNPFHPTSWARPASGLNDYKYDPKKAMDLLKQAGWEYKESEKLFYVNGKPAKFVLKYPTGNKPREKAGTIIQQQFKDIGIQLDLNLSEFATMYKDHKTGNFQLGLNGIGPNFATPDIYTSYHSSQIALGENNLNLNRYRNPKVDELILKARSFVSDADRKPVLQELGLILNDELPMVYLFHWNEGRVINGKLKGVDCISSSYSYKINKWYFEK